MQYFYSAYHNLTKPVIPVKLPACNSESLVNFHFLFNNGVHIITKLVYRREYVENKQAVPTISYVQMWFALFQQIIVLSTDQNKDQQIKSY